MTARSRRTNPYSEVWGYFQNATREHELTVIQEDGVYRHLRMGKPDTRVWSWEIITWPGHLTITGDVGDGFTFARTHDMFDFFDESGYDDYYGDGSPFINPGYWAEKLGHAQRGTEKNYSEDVFIDSVRQTLEDVRDCNNPDLDINDYIDQARSCADNEHEARDWARSHTYTLGSDFFWETDFSAFSEQYLIACYAIATTVRHYKQRDHRPGAIS